MKPLATALPVRITRKPTVALDGSSLTIGDLIRLIDDENVQVHIDPAALVRMKKYREFLLDSAQNQAIYGVNTGFGPMVTHIIGAEQITELQYNLIRGHATGMGEPIKSQYVLAAMAVRLNTLVKGNSGASVELAETLRACINQRITPIVPEHGAVGTSGDLVQLAHIALMLIGEGEVMYKGKRILAKRALKDAGIMPHTLGPKEGLSLINGTSVMSGIGSILARDASRALSLAMRTGALALELVHGFTDVLDPVLHAARPHPGQERVAEILRNLTADSKMLSNREERARRIAIKDKTYETDVLLQEVYSLRCIPQILGPIFDTLQRTKDTLTIEANSVTDNPVIDLEHKRFLHGGNFHGDYIATAIDQLKAGIIKMTLLSERRINFFLNKNINKAFSPFLNLETPGLTMGLQGLQFVATSTTAQSQSLGYPHSLHSISTNSDNQDVVSMGTDAALIAAKTIENIFIVLAIELVTLSQAAALLNRADQSEKKLSSASRRLLAVVRAQVPPVTQDRILTSEVEALRKALAQDATLDIGW